MSWQKERGRNVQTEALIEGLKKQHREICQEIYRMREKMHNSWGEPVSVIKGLQDMADQYHEKESKLRRELEKHGEKVKAP